MGLSYLRNRFYGVKLFNFVIEMTMILIYIKYVSRLWKIQNPKVEWEKKIIEILKEEKKLKKIVVKLFWNIWFLIFLLK